MTIRMYISFQRDHNFNNFSYERQKENFVVGIINFHFDSFFARERCWQQQQQQNIFGKMRTANAESNN